MCERVFKGQNIEVVTINDCSLACKSKIVLSLNQNKVEENLQFKNRKSTFFLSLKNLGIDKISHLGISVKDKVKIEVGLK